MDPLSTFSGFPQAGLEFLASLAAHNNRVWFEAHKNDYQTFLLEPAQAFVLTLGARIADGLEWHSLRYAYRRKGGVDASSPRHPFQPGQEPIPHPPQWSFLGGEPEKDRASRFWMRKSRRQAWR